jgi:SsrA-binding protein
MTKTIENRKAHHDYSIIDEYEAGIKLQSWEVKSIAENVCSIVGAHCKVINNELFLVGSTMGRLPNDQFRFRKLLLTRKQIDKITGQVAENGVSLIPLSIHQKNGKFKLLIGVCKGKKKHDKRESDKKRTIENENRRIVKSQRITE